MTCVCCEKYPASKGSTFCRRCYAKVEINAKRQVAFDCLVNAAVDARSTFTDLERASLVRAFTGIAISLRLAQGRTNAINGPEAIIRGTAERTRSVLCVGESAR